MEVDASSKDAIGAAAAGSGGSTSGKSKFALDADTFKKIHPSEFHRRFLERNVRPDGRLISQFRNAGINCGSITTASGSAMVKLGGTMCLCGIKAEVAVPSTNTPRDGYFVPNVDFPPLCSSAFRPGAPGELTQSVSEFIHKTFMAAKVLNLEDLCIAEGKAVWVIYADIVFLNYEGNPIDAAILALTAALRNTRLPKATFSETEGTVKRTAECPISLRLSRTLTSATFGIYEGRDGQLRPLADPTDEEECVLAAKMTVVIDTESGAICGSLKSGGVPVSMDMTNGIMESAATRAKEIQKVIVENS